MDKPVTKEAVEITALEEVLRTSMEANLRAAGMWRTNNLGCDVAEQIAAGIDAEVSATAVILTMLRALLTERDAALAAAQAARCEGLKEAAAECAAEIEDWRKEMPNAVDVRHGMILVKKRILARARALATPPGEKA